MMKTNLKLIAVLLCFYFSVTTASAQSKKANKKAFIGIWEMSMEETGGKPLQNIGPGLLKIFNADGTLTILQVHRTGTAITQSGKYDIDDLQSYTETIMYRLKEDPNDPVGHGFKINYELSQDQKTLTAKFTYKDGTPSTEVWRKL